jgi:hypothetical protein
MKKRFLEAASLLLIVVAAIMALRLAATSPQIHSSRPFESFPVGQSVPVNFQFDGAFGDFSRLEKRNQMRDWVLYTIMSDTGLDPGALRKALYDVPPMRSRYLEGVAHFDYSETRSRSIGNGEVVAIVPKSTAGRRNDNLADIADREFKNTGQRPRLVHVFEYQLSEDTASARVLRQETLEGSRLFTADYGYLEAPVQDRAEFVQFMGSVDELLGARFNSGVLYLSGRKRLGSKYRGLRVEDTAALWQSEIQVQAADERVHAFEAKWKGVTYQTESEKTELEARYARELDELKKSMPGTGSRGLLEHSGFSLDPAFDYEKLRSLFDYLTRGIAQTEMANRIDETRAAITRRDEGPLLQLLYDLEKSSSPLEQKIGKFGENSLDLAKFQHARYDGPLGGTEVGMDLFYTDLLAKLWALDFADAAPDRQVEDFQSLLKIAYSPIYELEIQKLSNTRLWFGPLDDGFQKTETGILFAPKATRVYAASSNTLKPGEESEPNAASAAFLGWWDRHYDDIATFEPEYQRLNEIMKWSLLLSWMGERDTMNNLNFLGAEHVSHAAWFPDWARSRADLKFSYWDRIKFYPKGYKGVQTESLPLLATKWQSPANGTVGYSGGVSLGSKDVVAEHPVLPKDIDPLLMRSNLNYGAHEAGAEAFQTFDKTAYDFHAEDLEGRFVVSAQAKDGAKLRSVDSEVSNAPFEYAWKRDAGGLAVDMKNGDVQVGQFVTGKKGNGFTAAFRSFDLERGNEFARVVDDATKRSVDVAQALAGRPSVAAAIKTPDGYLIHTHGTVSRWIKISPEGAPSTDIAQGAQMRYAPIGGGGASRLNVAWVSDRDAAAELNQAQFIVINQPNNDLPNGLAMEVTNRGPPPPFGPEMRVELKYGNDTVSGRKFGNNGPVYVERAKLPPKVTQDADMLSTPSFGSGGGGQGKDPFSSFASAEDGDYRYAAKRLVVGPADFESEFSKYRQQNINSIDHMLAEGKTAEAESRIEQVIAAFGDDPKLVQRSNTLARAADLSHHLDAIPGMQAHTVTFVGQGQLKIELRLLDLRKSAASVAEARASGKVVYIRSDRAMNDVNASVLPSLDQVLSNDNVVSKLVNWEIAKARPDLIEDEATGEHYRLWSQGVAQNRPQNLEFGSWSNLARYSPMDQDPCSNASVRLQRPDCEQNVYLIDPQPNMIASSAHP